MFAILGLDHLVLRVKDLDTMMHFYAEVLGCTVEKTQPDIGLYQLRAGNALIDLVPVDGTLGQQGGQAPGSEGHNLDHFCLRIEPLDFNALQSHFSSHGVSLGEVQSRYGAEGQGPSVYLSDPEGNTIELKGPADASL